MSRILFAWELGGNLGHVTRQLSIARRLRQKGHPVFFVVRDTAVAAQLLTPEGFAYTQAPINVAKNRLPHPVNYAEILIASGYAEPVVLLGLVQGWISLIRLFKANLIVVDHAPTALVAARLTGLPAITIGTGFEIPPDRLPLPSIRPWETIPKNGCYELNNTFWNGLMPLRPHQMAVLSNASPIYSKALVKFWRPLQNLTIMAYVKVKITLARYLQAPQVNPLPGA